MEHAVYLCAWKRTRSRFTLWVHAQPNLRGEGVDYAEAEERLLDAIQTAGGAMQAVLEFDPPLPRSASEARYTQLELLLIGGDDRFEADTPRSTPFETPQEREQRLQYSDRYFQQALCRQCFYTSAPRSERPLSLSYAPARYDGAFGTVGHHAGVHIQIVSQEFVDLLTPEETAGLELRPVTHTLRNRSFYEVLGPGGPRSVAVAGLPISGWRCAACGHRTWGYWIKGLTINSFIAADDLPRTLPGVFTIGAPPDVQLVATADRWRELVGRRGTRGFVSRRLGVVPISAVTRTPNLELRQF